MLKKKTIKYLTKNFYPLSGKTYLITGANSGVGLKATEELIYMGAHVIMACRNIKKAASARKELLAEYPSANITLMELDIASFRSIDAFIANIINDHIDIDGFVNNAGVFHIPHQYTKNGWECVMGTNYIGTYYLSEHVIPYLLSLNHHVDYIVTSSVAYKRGHINYNNFFGQQKYRKMSIYAQSKLCVTKYAFTLAKRLKGTNINVIMTHPGVTVSPLMQKAYSRSFFKFVDIFKWIFMDNEKAALSIPYVLAKQPKNGTMHGPNILWGAWGYPKPNHILNKTYKDNDILITYTNHIIEITPYDALEISKTSKTKYGFTD